VSRTGKKGRDKGVGDERSLARHPRGNHAGVVCSGEQRPEKVSRSSWLVVVRERDGVGGCCEGEE
jgi:hypothetical protein